jgi:hypothetical protein
MTRQPPPVTSLNHAQTTGWSCCWCDKTLWTGAISAGIARGRSGAHDLSVEVYACPSCARSGPPVPNTDTQGDA